MRQGDPLSALLFIHAIEDLTTPIRSNKKIKGICIDEHATKFSMLADATTLLLAAIISHNIKFVFFILSRLKINYEKDEML